MSNFLEGYTVTNAAGPPSDQNLHGRDNAAIVEMEVSRKQPSMQDDRKLKGKALINFLMQNDFFLALYRSNDARTRATAIDKLNKAHTQAYGNLPK